MQGGGRERLGRNMVARKRGRVGRGESALGCSFFSNGLSPRETPTARQRGERGWVRWEELGSPRALA